MSLSITESQALTALRSFLLTVLPGVEVVKAQANLVAEPPGPNFVAMTPLFRTRLATNIDTYEDCAFTGSISGNTVTVTAMKLGTITVGATLFGTGIAAGTTIIAPVTGSGGVGTYTVSQSQTVPSEVMACGSKDLLQKTQMTVQLDVYGPAAGDNAQVVATTFRDSYAVESFASSGFDVTPLYCEDPKQMPFINGEAQYQDRWTFSCVMQVNPVVSVPQQFADQLNVNIISVDAAYPAV